ncbi:hypothetical protein [Saccharicrinis sp. FJH54]|uniref:hypothetical protein n=1 Tax=Saccharicrinis sp. FJH54 TaxID=3344665 RepID=UPI0035D4DF28
MKRLLLILIVFGLISIHTFSQDSIKYSDYLNLDTADNIDTAQIKKLLFNAFGNSFNDTVFKYIMNKQIDLLYEMADDDLKKIQTNEDLNDYFNLLYNYYGIITDYEQTGFYFKSTPKGMMHTSIYAVNFNDKKGSATIYLHEVDSLNSKLLGFNLKLDDYTYLNKMDSIAIPIINAILQKDKKSIYSFTSQRFKEYNSVAEFESLISKILSLKVDNHKMFQNQISISNGNESIAITYAINNEEGYLRLTFTNIDNKMYLEGINYKEK